MEDPKPTFEEQLFGSAASGDLPVLSYLLERLRVPPDIRDQYGTTPLMEACRFGHGKCVRFLVGAGADVNARDKEKMTALMYACDGAAAKHIVAFLIANDAEVNALDVYSSTALMRAAARGAVGIVDKLIASGANVNQESKNHETPLTFAIVWNQIECVERLIAAKADLNWTDPQGWTPLQYALHEGHDDIARLLEKQGARLTTSD